MTSAGHRVPVLEIGGTHVTAALVDLTKGQVVDGVGDRQPLRGGAKARTLLDAVVRCAATVGAQHDTAWGVAVPGPFDYAQGVAWFEGVGKFDALRGVDIGSVLRREIEPAPSQVRFCNDAVAFALGEWAFGAGGRCDRMVGITLGTGIGSGFLADGIPIERGTDVPPGGEIHLLSVHGQPLEETVSRRAILRSFAHRAGELAVDVEEGLDVREIADRARSGDPLAHRVLHDAFYELGLALAPWLIRFQASTVVVGGSMSRSWDLVYPALRSGLGAEDPALVEDVQVLAGHDVDHAALLGAALAAARPS